MKTIQCARQVVTAVFVGFALMGELGASSPLDWEVGDYWTYQVQAWADDEETRATLNYSVSYYVVAYAELLQKRLWALAEVRELPDGGKFISPLIVFTFPPDPKPKGWPLPARAAPKGLSVVRRATPLPGEGVSQAAETQEGGTLHRYLVEGAGTEEIKVPAGTFPCRRIHYLELILQEEEEVWQDEGTAWWGEEAGWWVKIEGESQGGRLRTLGGYRLELSAWGHLSEEELKERLSAALSATARWMPHPAEEVERQLSELGLELEIHIP